MSRNTETFVAEEHSTENGKPECVILNNVVMGKKLNEGDSMFGPMILDTFNQYPDFVGMLEAKTGQKITFGEMRDRSIRCALWLQKQGIGENDVVGISTLVQMNDYVPYLATLFVNAIVNPWDYVELLASAQSFLETCRPKVTFATAESIDTLAEIAEKTGIECKFVTFERHPKHVSLEEIMAEQTQDEVDNFECLVPSEPRKKVSRILFSSGTTSAPKAVLLPYHGLLTHHMDECGMRTGMTCLWYSPLAWITGGILTTAAIRLRCTRVVHGAFDLEATAAIVEKFKINFIFCSPYSLIQCHQADVFRRYDFTHVEIILFAGTKINKAMLEGIRKSLPRTFVRGSYGTTEAGGWVTRQTENSRHADSIGYLCKGIELKIVDQNDGSVLGPNREDEIYLKTDHSMLGYFRNTEETKKTIDKEGWIRSGDLGRYSEDGEVFIGDRLKAMIKTKLYTLSPFDFEEILMQHPQVKDCAVVGVPHPTDIERPFGFVVGAADAQVTAEELIDFVAKRNERYRLTGGLVFVVELPYTKTGKRRLRKIQELAREHAKQ